MPGGVFGISEAISGGYLPRLCPRSPGCQWDASQRQKMDTEIFCRKGNRSPEEAVEIYEGTC